MVGNPWYTNAIVVRVTAAAVTALVDATARGCARSHANDFIEFLGPGLFDGGVASGPESQNDAGTHWGSGVFSLPAEKTPPRTPQCGEGSAADEGWLNRHYGTGHGAAMGRTTHCALRISQAPTYCLR
ncbi:hypothetical protein GCM10017690_04980 [Microbacterium terregens]